MSEKRAYLVVGGDSLVGGGVARALKARGHKYYVTTRRRDTLSAQRLFLDFESAEPLQVPDDVGYAFVVAAATNYDRCETDPKTWVINTELVPRSVLSFLECGLFVSYISTNSVFGGQRPWPSEDDPHDPGIAYARQKSESETRIRDAAGRVGALERLNIVRLTKILDATVPPIPMWIDSWRRGCSVQPFSDLIFAPISLSFVSNSLASIGERRPSGNLHLSGLENLSYVQFANALAMQLSIAPDLVGSTTASEKGVEIPFKPRYSGLGMSRTTELTGIRPQSVAEVARDLAKELEGGEFPR